MTHNMNNKARCKKPFSVVKMTISICVNRKHFRMKSTTKQENKWSLKRTVFSFICSGSSPRGLQHSEICKAPLPLPVQNRWESFWYFPFRAGLGLLASKIIQRRQGNTTCDNKLSKLDMTCGCMAMSSLYPSFASCFFQQKNISAKKFVRQQQKWSQLTINI